MSGFFLWYKSEKKKKLLLKENNQLQGDNSNSPVV